LTIYQDEIHQYFWIVHTLTGGDMTLHKSKLEELYKTPYTWFLAYIDKANKND
jgi:hypothetical protein